jgi:hypothetical protein
MSETIVDAIAPLVAKELKIGGYQGYVEEEISGDLLILWHAPFVTGNRSEIVLAVIRVGKRAGRAKPVVSRKLLFHPCCHL